MMKKSLGSTLLTLFLALTVCLNFGLFAQAEEPANLLENPGFEQKAEDGTIPSWLPVRTGGAEVTDATAYSGRYSLKVDEHSDSLNGGAYSVTIPAQPGERFRSEAFVKVEQGTAVLFMQFVNAEGTHHSYAKSWQSGPTSGKWVKAIVEGTVPEGAVGVRMLPYSGAAGACLCYFDDITMVKRGENVLSRQFGPVQTIPDAVLNKLGQSAAIGIGADGRPEVYFFANGAPGTFYALDAATGERRFSQQVPLASIVWGMAYSPDGNVYFASSENGRLFRYSPSERKIADLGVNPSGSFVWDIDASPDGRFLYGAIYPKGKIFEYDTELGTFKDLGTIMEGKDYVRGLGVTDRYVYAGLGTYEESEPRVMVRIDRETGAKSNIAVPSASTFISDAHAYNGRLFATSGALYVLNEESFKPIGSHSFGSMISPPSPLEPNLVYWTGSGKIFSYNTDTDVKREVGTLPPMETGTLKALGWIQPAEGDFAGKTVLAGVSQYGESFLFDPVSGRTIEVKLDIDGSPVQHHSMKAGPDGRLYLGGYHQGLSIYDPETRSFPVRQFHTSQAESIGFLNGKVYFGMYGGALIYEYNPALPWKYGTAAGNNPYRIYDIQEQDRPYVFASGDNKLFIGTIPDYGKLGGKLTVFDAEAKTWKEHDHTKLVRNQSITGLAYHNGKLYGSTSIRGGLGIDPSETEAKLFIWDVAQEKKILERTLDLPGHQPPMIGNLAVGPDGLVWGATGSAIFALDPETLDVVKGKSIYSPTLDSLGSWRPFDLLFGDDGYIYTTIGQAITVIDPKTLEHEQLAEKANLIALGKDGSVYYSISDKNIYRIPVKLQTVKLTASKSKLPVNGTAELKLEGVLANGKPANLSAASIRYVSSDPSIVTVDESGRATAHLPGTAEVYAEVSLDGTTAASKPVTIRVVASSK
jgi:outer membrane protein assembly factor BamB